MNNGVLMSSQNDQKRDFLPGKIQVNTPSSWKNNRECQQKFSLAELTSCRLMAGGSWFHDKKHFILRVAY